MGRAEDLRDRVIQQGEAAIDQFILDRQSEELFLDFKRSGDNGQGSRLNDSDRANLAKAISGFGNGAGGVVIWGVDCSQDDAGNDVARCKHPLTDAKGFLSRLEGAVSGCTVPAHSGVTNHAICAHGGTQGYALTYIPESVQAPHQVVVGKGKQYYYIRAGSDFVPTPHNVLAGLFGRKPQPKLHAQWFAPNLNVEGDSVTFEVGLIMNNQSMAMAHRAFVSVMAMSSGGPNCQTAFQPMDETNWSGTFSFGSVFFLCAKHDYVLPPGGVTIPMGIKITLAPPFTENLLIIRKDGCEGTPPVETRIDVTPEHLREEYDSFMVSWKAGPMDPDDKQDFIHRVIGIGGARNV